MKSISKFNWIGNLFGFIMINLMRDTEYYTITMLLYQIFVLGMYFSRQLCCEEWNESSKCEFPIAIIITILVIIWDYETFYLE
jgi:hypothetical protein